MKEDVLAWSRLEKVSKLPSKETLNHPELVRWASGLDPYENTKAAYLAAYRNLEIDIINRVPLENAPPPTPCKEVRDLGNGYTASYLGIYDTVSRNTFPFDDCEELLNSSFELDYSSLTTPVPHEISLADIKMRQEALGDTGLYYAMYYTTLFMWAVEYLGWEVFLTAAALEPEDFYKKFILKAYKVSKNMVDILCKAESPFVFLHDDLANGSGPMLNPDWYKRYIFPLYEELFCRIHRAGKKLIFVADGNMEAFLPSLRALGVDGVMLENPATGFDTILKYFSDRLIIGGMETQTLTFEKPDIVYNKTAKLLQHTRGVRGFAISCVGGLHGNIPLENLKAYFEAKK